VNGGSAGTFSTAQGPSYATVSFDDVIVSKGTAATMTSSGGPVAASAPAGFALPPETSDDSSSGPWSDGDLVDLTRARGRTQRLL